MSTPGVRLTLDYVRSAFAAKNCILLSTEYKNARTLLSYQCRNGHNNEQRFDEFRRNGCKYCSGKAKYTHDRICQLLNADGYTFMSGEYKNKKSVIKTLCPRKHEWDVIFDNYVQGKRCFYCFHDDIKKYTLEDVKVFLQRQNFQYISHTGLGTKDKVTFVCPNGHSCTSNIETVARGCLCKDCDLRSKGVKRIEEFLLANGIQYEKEKRFPDCRNKIPLPFDFYIPDKHILVEFDGR